MLGLVRKRRRFRISAWTKGIVPPLMFLSSGKYEIIGNDTVTIKSIIGDFTAKISKTGDELTSVHGKYRRLK